MPGEHILKRYVSVGDRIVHYRIAGEGPVALLLHDSVKSSQAVIPIIERLRGHFRVVALDTPGYGNSDPLPGTPEIADFARAVIETMDALGLSRVCVYGRHTSAKVVLELVAQWPERFHVGLLDGLSLPDRPYAPDYVDAYLPRFEIDAEGAYLARVWTQIRDMVRWFPWFSRVKETRMAVPRRESGAAHAYALDFFMAGPHYSSGYGAALRYVGWPRLQSLRDDAPAVFMATVDDVLYPFLDRLPDGLAVERVPADASAWLDRIDATFRRTMAGDDDWAPPAEPARCAYLNFGHGQLHVRGEGEGGGSPILYLHELPGGSAAAVPFLRALARHGPVVAPDLPGGGDSDPLPRVDPSGYVECLAALIDDRSASPVRVVATLGSTPLAVALAELHPDKVEALVLDGLVLSPAGPADLWCPPMRYDPSGAHVHRLWHMLRDQAVQWPWYDGSVAAIRAVDADLSGETLHRRLTDCLKQLDHYGDATRAALDFDTAAALARLTCPVLLPVVDGDPAYRAAAGMAGPNFMQVVRAEGPEALADQIGHFFRSA